MADTNTQNVSQPAEPKMFKITLKRVVRLHEFLYRPSEEHIVDEATLKEMGDAVDHAKPV